MLNVKVTLWVGRCLRLCIRMTGIRVGFRWNVQHLMEGGRGGGNSIVLCCLKFVDASFLRTDVKFFILCRKTVCFAFVDGAVRSRIISLSIV
jgi:hypothetical protein